MVTAVYVTQAVRPETCMRSPALSLARPDSEGL